ncbi:MAG TPA: MFS transporter [Acidimicrobiales bacterium]|nr:MFS transporter [Acidimicrobiales bacterium]
MSRAGATMGRTFDALRNYNYRLYFFGQIVSVSGTWMQSVAQAWLVLRLTGSGVDLGAVTAVQFTPMLIAGPMGGVIADRVDKRRLLVGTQTAAGLLALALGLLTATGAVRLWMIFALAFGLGCVNVVDMPTRQAFVNEMVGQERLANAVTLNSVVMNSARVVGPAVAGVLIATVGIAICFLINAGSYLAVIAGLMAMRRSELSPAPTTGRRRGQLREGLRYVWSTPNLRTPLLMMAVIGLLAYNFNVTLPLMAKYTFHAGAGAFGAMSSFMGGGAVIGGLITASRGQPTSRRLVGVAALFGGMILVCAAMPGFAVELIALAIMGAFSIAFIATANTTLQLRSAPEMRGRVMALYSVAFLGSAPIGGPVVGWVGQVVGPRAALALGGVATLVAAAVAAPSLLGGDSVLSLARRRRVRAAGAGFDDADTLRLGDGPATAGTELGVGDAVAAEVMTGEGADAEPDGGTGAADEVGAVGGGGGLMEASGRRRPG